MMENPTFTTASLRQLNGDEKTVGAGPPVEAENATRGVNSTSPLGRSILGRFRTPDLELDPGPPPDGGWNAWSQALCVHLVVFNSWGMVNSFSLFQSYETIALNRPPSDISWIGSAQIWLLFFVGTFSGRATDAGYFKLTFVAGCFFQTFGEFMASVSKTYVELFLSQGICVGLGNGLVFTPAVALLATYFSKHRAFSISIAASGAATGGIIYPAIAERLLYRIGFGWTLRVMAFLMLATQALAIAAFREPSFLLFAIGNFFVFWGLYFGFYYIGSFARDILHVSRSSSINLLIIMNGVGLPGRIIPAIISDRYLGPLNMLIIFEGAASLLIFCWAAVQTHVGLILFCVVYGFFGGGIQSLVPTSVSSLTQDLEKVGVRMGMTLSVMSFAALTGPPLAGALVSRDDGKYLLAQMWAGSVMIGGVLTVSGARIARTGLQPFVKI